MIKFDFGEKESIPGIDDLFKNTTELYKTSPHFWNSIVVAHLKAIISKDNYGSNEATYEKNSTTSVSFKPFTPKLLKFCR